MCASRWSPSATAVPVGFIMARVDLGEFGRIESTAVMDTIGIDPDYRDQGVGRALLSQLLVNLMTLRVEHIRTEVDWRDRDLLGFLDHCGFRPVAAALLRARDRTGRLSAGGAAAGAATAASARAASRRR